MQIKTRVDCCQWPKIDYRKKSGGISFWKIPNCMEMRLPLLYFIGGAWHGEVKGDKYSICRLTFESCPSEATNRKPSKTQIQFRTDLILQAIADWCKPFPKCPKTLLDFSLFPFLYLTASRQEIWMMYKGSVSNQFRIRKSERSLQFNWERGEGRSFSFVLDLFLLLSLNMLCSGTEAWHGEKLKEEKWLDGQVEGKNEMK